MIGSRGRTAAGRIRMKINVGWAALAILGLAGCAAGTKPCMIIPAQIELAADVRDAARGKVDERKAEYQRLRVSLEQSETRLARLTEERDQLKKEVGGTPAEEKKP
jgi:predicted nuclease with TOPRIM domain